MLIETSLNLVWMALATGVFIAASRSSNRTRIALLCAVALMFPIISVSDDFNSSTASIDDVAALVVAMIVIAVVLVALSRIHSVVEPAHANYFATLSDPRSPPHA